jgi:hypothetical protein
MQVPRQIVLIPPKMLDSNRTMSQTSRACITSF